MTQSDDDQVHDLDEQDPNATRILNCIGQDLENVAYHLPSPPIVGNGRRHPISAPQPRLAPLTTESAVMLSPMTSSIVPEVTSAVGLISVASMNSSRTPKGTPSIDSGMDKVSLSVIFLSPIANQNSKMMPNSSAATSTPNASTPSNGSSSSQLPTFSNQHTSPAASKDTCSPVVSGHGPNPDSDDAVPFSNFNNRRCHNTYTISYSIFDNLPSPPPTKLGKRRVGALPETPKRGRGRPRKLIPGNIPSPPLTTPRRGRGRPRKAPPSTALSPSKAWTKLRHGPTRPKKDVAGVGSEEDEDEEQKEEAKQEHGKLKRRKVGRR